MHPPDTGLITVLTAIHFFNEIINLSVIAESNQGLEDTVGGKACWAGFLLYIWLREGFLQEPCSFLGQGLIPLSLLQPGGRTTFTSRCLVS